MGKKTAIFIEGQHVFAKVKGYSPWPAKITKVIAKHKYGVYFYGTGETASVKSEDLDPYDEKNRIRFNTDRQLKKNEYKEAVDQIQAALNGNDPAPIDDKFSKNNAELETMENITDDDDSGDESQLQISKPVLNSTSLPQKRKAVALKEKQEIKHFSTEPEAKENDEKVSRSGRKIKEKKMNYDEMDPDEMFTQPKKRSKVEDGRKSATESTNAIDEFRASKIHILLDPVKKRMLENQYEMVQKMQEIKLALGLEQADINRSIELLETFKENILPHITDLMLLKYPNVVETVKRLRKYIGNMAFWTMEEKQIEEFNAKAGNIRTIASFLYDSFKALFNHRDEISFWNNFADQQKTFHEKYNILSPVDLFEGLSYNELDSLLNSRESVSLEDTPTLSKDVEIETSAPEDNEQKTKL